MGDNYDIGSLNPIFRTKFAKVKTHFDRLKLGVLSKFVDASYNQEDNREAIGEMRGVVVGIAGEPKENWPFDFGVWGGDSSELVKIHVRIPEIHGYMPDPFEFPEGSLENINLAKMYPVFTGEVTDKRTPQSHDIVLVDFFNPYEKSAGGNYLGLVSKASEMLVQEVQSGLNAFQNGGTVGKMSNFNSAEKTGDGIYVPGNAKVFKIIKGYYVNGKTSFLSEFDGLDNNPPLPMQYIKKIIYVISSRCSTSPQFVSTQDKLTIGFRRLAAEGLNKLLQKHYGFGTSEAIANNYAKAIQISEDPKWIKIQYDDYKKSLVDSLKTHRFTRAREIVLWERIKNSAPAWLTGYSNKSYEILRNMYISKKYDKDRKTNKGLERILELEAYIPANEIWR